jgi:hypothetical protein
MFPCTEINGWGGEERFFFDKLIHASIANFSFDGLDSLHAADYKKKMLGLRFLLGSV